MPEPRATCRQPSPCLPTGNPVWKLVRRRRKRRWKLVREAVLVALLSIGRAPQLVDQFTRCGSDRKVARPFDRFVGTISTGTLRWRRRRLCIVRALQRGPSRLVDRVDVLA